MDLYLQETTEIPYLRRRGRAVSSVFAEESYNKGNFTCCSSHTMMGHFPECFSDEKIGYWPLVEQMTARRASRNLPACNLETKPYFIGRGSYNNRFLTSVIPAVQNEFPRNRSQKIIVQEDNESPQNIADYDEIVAACNEALTANIVFQSTSRPDLNVLDVVLFFHSVSSHSNKC